MHPGEQLPSFLVEPSGEILREAADTSLQKLVVNPRGIPSERSPDRLISELHRAPREASAQIGHARQVSQLEMPLLVEICLVEAMQQQVDQPIAITHPHKPPDNNDLVAMIDHVTGLGQHAGGGSDHRAPGGFRQEPGGLEDVLKTLPGSSVHLLQTVDEEAYLPESLSCSGLLVDDIASAQEPHPLRRLFRDEPLILGQQPELRAEHVPEHKADPWQEGRIRPGRRGELPCALESPRQGAEHLSLVPQRPLALCVTRVGEHQPVRQIHALFLGNERQQR
jgi:hypothetical protein